jgi:hypothetical protein
MSTEDGGILIGFAGDVLIDRDDPDEVFADVQELLGHTDILFANLESPYSDHPEAAFTMQLVPLAPGLSNLNAYARAGFNVLSMANNHIVDAGHVAMLDTQRRLGMQGVATCGAGENLAAARKPAVVERGGKKVGFLAYASVFPHGYEASSNVPGLAPLRAHNHFYDQTEYFAPGYAPRVETIPDPKDHINLERDIEALRKNVDLVVMSFHWGDHLRPFSLTDHEKRTARLCIDRGADLDHPRVIVQRGSEMHDDLSPISQGAVDRGRQGLGGVDDHQVARLRELAHEQEECRLGRDCGPVLVDQPHPLCGVVDHDTGLPIAVRMHLKNAQGRPVNLSDLMWLSAKSSTSRITALQGP